MFGILKTHDNGKTEMIMITYDTIEAAQEAQKLLARDKYAVSYSIVEIFPVQTKKRYDMNDEETEQYNKDVLEINKDLEDVISYDEWSAREYGETSVDYYSTAQNLYDKGYRRIHR